MLSYRRDTALQGALVLAKSGRLELGDNSLRTLQVNHCNIIGLQSCRIRWKNAKWGLLRRSRSSRSVPIKSLYATSY